LRARELDARSLLDNMPGFVCRLSPDGTPEIFNRTFLQYLGRTQEDVGKWRTTDIVHPDDLAHTIEVFGNAISTGQPFDFEYRLCRSDGVYRWFQARGIPLRNRNGQILQWNTLVTDIEDRKRTEAALQLSERNLRQVIDTIPTLIHVLRPDGSVLYVSPGVLEYTGLTLEDVQQEDYRTRVWHPDDADERSREQRAHALLTPVPFESEYRVRGKDGKYRWFLARYNPLVDDQGKIDRWYVAATDIDDRKRAEEALRQSEERAHLMVDSIDGQIMTATPRGEVEFVNQQVLDYFGKSLEELKDWRTNDAIHPDDLSRALALWTHSIETEKPYQFDQRLRRADGEYRWFRVSGRCVHDDEGNVVRWYVLLTDIDEGKRAEAQVEQAYLRLSEAQQLSKTGSFITDLLVDDHNWSEEAYRIFEFDPGTKLSTQLIRDRVYPEDLLSFDDVLARGMQGINVDFVFRIVTSQGVKHVRGMARVMEQIAGRPLFIGAFQDVTESKAAEEALTSARSELAHMARVTTLSALTASIAHEINQPIAAAITSAGACLRWLNRDQPDVERARAAATRIEEDGKRAADIISHLKSFYKKEVSPEREMVSVNDVVAEMLVLLRSEADSHSVVMRTERAADLPSVRADRVLLQQVLMNLMQNGIEAMSVQGGELKIRTQLDNRGVVVSVSDTGPGVPAEKIEEIFDAFVTTKPGGTGMGLAISRTIIESHRGRLWATVNDGPGASFHFTLPTEPES
ncbi:MAG TPA: PAS domain-containing protein, partial [Pyrinomonadaceae bacterium]|nr:PAS domain-containing protein [Pyrinomonadaceae bacterium]